MNNNSKNQPSLQIGDKLKKRRKDLKITQTELAKFIGCTAQQIQKYEGGHSRVSVSTFLKVCEFLNTPPAYFFPKLSFRENIDAPSDINLEEKLLEFFRAVTNKKVKERIINLVEALANDTNNE